MITFASQSITKKEKDYEVAGVLTLHGIARTFKFPFSIEEMANASGQKPKTRIKGTWVINRKEFSVSWNKLLDRKGILVGDYVTVNWEVVLR